MTRIIQYWMNVSLRRKSSPDLDDNLNCIIKSSDYFWNRNISCSDRGLHIEFMYINKLLHMRLGYDAPNCMLIHFLRSRKYSDFPLIRDSYSFSVHPVLMQGISLLHLSSGLTYLLLWYMPKKKSWKIRL